LVRTYNAGLSFALLFFLFLGSQTLLKILHYCPISPCIQHCIAALLGKYYIIIQFLHTFRNISSFDQFRPDLDYARCMQKYFEFRPISTGFGLRGSLARQPCPAVLPGSLARQPCPAALPGSLARQLCPATLLGSSTNFDRI
jgi:hypothetical protein